MALSFTQEFETPYEDPVSVSSRITRVLARNPGPFTFKGTGTYIVGAKRVAVIDPGPDLPEHVAALKRALAGKTVEQILVTHTHLDHSPAAKPLQEWSGAPTLGFGPHGSRSITSQSASEESADLAFVPDIQVKDGDLVQGEDFSLECVFTPGHTSNHMCFALREENALFSGDHVMGWSTSVVAPPDGDMSRYITSLGKLIERDDAILYPTHGAPISNPKPFLRGYLAHRLEREQQILECLQTGISTIPEMTRAIYARIDPRLHAAAGRSILAHLLKLRMEGRIYSDGDNYYFTAKPDHSGDAL